MTYGGKGSIVLTKLDPVLALVFLALRVVSFAHRLVSAMSVPPLRHARRNGHGQASEPAGVPAGRPAGRQDGAGRSEEQQRQHRVATAAQRRAEEGAGGRAHQRAHLARCRAAAVRSRVSAAQPLARRQSCGHEARALTVRVRCAHVHEHAAAGQGASGCPRPRPVASGERPQAPAAGDHAPSAQSARRPRRRMARGGSCGSQARACARRRVGAPPGVWGAGGMGSRCRCAGPCLRRAAAEHAPRARQARFWAAATPGCGQSRGAAGRALPQARVLVSLCGDGAWGLGRMSAGKGAVGALGAGGGSSFSVTLSFHE